MNKNTKSLITLLAVAFGMIGLAFASVPLYRAFCQMTGWDGTPAIYVPPPKAEDARDSHVLVQFNADIDPSLPWEFKPEDRRINTQIGVSTLTSYEARNLTDKPTTGTAVYNVSPEKAGPYFKKVMCFCFGQQSLEPGQRADLPVQFFVDPKFAEDPEMRDVKIITLSYTFYPANSEKIQEAIDKGFKPIDK